MEISDNNNNDTIATATTTAVEEGKGKGKVGGDHNQPETPIIFDQKRWDLQRRYLTNPFKYLGNNITTYLTPRSTCLA